MTLRTLNYGNYGIFLIMGNAGFCPSTVSAHAEPKSLDKPLELFGCTFLSQVKVYLNPEEPTFFGFLIMISLCKS